MTEISVSNNITLYDFLKSLPWYQQVKIVTLDIGCYLNGSRRKVFKQLTQEQLRLKVKDFTDFTFIPLPFRRELVRQIVIYCEKEKKAANKNE